MTDTLIIGGSSGMGLALAQLLVADGQHVTLAGRSADRLDAARRLLATGPGTVTVRQADITRESDIAALFEHGPIEHVAVTAADATGVYGPVTTVPSETARGMLAAKVLGAWLIGKYGAGTVTGSITFTSGFNSYRPNGSNTIVAAANSALDGLARGLAIELAPVRVNVVSPGWVDTPIWDGLPMDKEAAFAELAARLPVRRVGRPDDIADAFLACMRNTFMTGSVLHVDGGHRFV
ncbi:SDR family oxidoreductase [Nocardia stercoris]|uniref:SDR family oxidoreductase n=1 Tax=Nocardia stercoris TaxID=2483361 RepID=A0A3M2L355_9NOCA|nr:SDR family oxidoreductase [Nocardia stercoris]RMI32149.1 SDR family oxidoreductase [Nocardia stercoris]